MSNLHKAAQAIAAAELPGRVLHESQALALANVLAAAGLLAPDLPEPDPSAVRDGVFRAGAAFFDARSVEAFGDQVIIHGSRPRHAPIGQARSLALALLSACDYAEKEQGNG